MTIGVGIRLTAEGAQGVQAALDRVAQSVERLEARSAAGASGAASLAGALSGVAGAVGGFAALQQAAGYVVSLSAAMLQAQVRAEGLSTGLSFAVSGGAAQELAYLRGVTEKLGLEFHSTSTAYMKFAAASRETALEGAGARKVFEAVSKASAVMGLTAEESSGALNALAQMVSKGTVQSEELKGQLGERLPGAFLIAARAMGVTTAELGKMLEQGQVIADDFLPKFAAQLEKELGDAAEKAGGRAEASLNRVANAWARLKETTAQSGVSEFITGQLNILGDAFTNVSDRMSAARAEGGGFLAQMAAGGVGVLQFLNPLNAVSYSAESAGEKLKQAEAELQRLQAAFDKEPGFYLGAELGKARELVEELRRAKEAREELAGGGGSQSQQFGQASKAIAQIAAKGAAEQAAAEERLAGIRTKLTGVSTDYLKTLRELQGMREKGIVGEAEYVRLVSDLAKANYKAKDANKALDDSFKSLVESLKERVAGLRAEVVAGRELTPMQKLQAETNAKLDGSLVKLKASQKAQIESLLQGALALEAENRAREAATAGTMAHIKAREEEFTALQAARQSTEGQLAEQLAANAAGLAGADASEKFAIAKLREAAAVSLATAVKVEDKNADFALGEQYRKNAAALTALADARAAALAGSANDKARKELDDFLDPGKAESFGDALRGAFDGAANALVKLSDVLGDYSRKQSAIAAERAKLSKIDNPYERWGLEMKLNERAADQQIENYANIAGAAKGFFAEGTKGYKTLQAAETAFRAYQLASDLIKGASAAAVAVANQAQGDPYTAWARMAAMAAAMGTLGFAVAGGFNRGSAAPSAAERQEANGTGTILGDAKAKSDSIARSLDAIEDTARIELQTQSGMLRSLRNIEASLAGLGNLVVRSNGITTGKNFGIKTGTLSVNEGDPILKMLGINDSGVIQSLAGAGSILGKLGVLGQSLWGKVKQDVTDAGLSIGGSVADLSAGRGVRQYADVTQTSSSWFGLKKDTSTSTQFGDVSGDLASQFGMVFANIGQVLKGAAGELGRDGEAVAQQVAQFVVDIPRLSLKGLSGEEVQEAISNAISASADKAAQAVVGGLEDFQKIGEGYFETVVRVSAGVESASYELEKLGIAAVSFGSIANKQGDIAAEIVRQSIVASETAGGALSNIGQIISNFDGDAAEIAETFGALVDVRDALKLAGISGDALTVSLVRAAGGLDELAGLLDDYYGDYFTAEERRAATLAQVRAGLAELGEVLPETRDGFRAIVERIGGKGDAGALAAVLRLADAFASVTPSADDLARAASDAAKDAADAAEKAAKDRAKAAEDAAEAGRKAADTAAAAQARARKAFDDIAADMVAGVADAFDEVRSQVEAETDRINDETQKQVDALDKRADDVRSVFEKVADAMGDLRDSLQQTIDEISGELAGDEGRALARERLSAMLATARAGGALDPDAVKQAVGVAARLSTDGFSSKADYLRDAARLQDTLRGLSDEAGRQTEAAQAAMNAELQGIAEEVAGVKDKADAQLKVLRKQLDEAQTAASALASIDAGVRTVASAIAALSGAIAATKAVTSGDGAVTGRWQQSGDGEVYRDANGAVGVRKTGDTDAAGLQIRGKLTSFTAQEAIDWIDAQVTAGNALAVYNRAHAEGLSLSTLDQLMAGKGWKPGTAEAWAKANSLPAFADGGYHTGGFRLVGENGPEIEATGPARIHTFDQLMTMAGGGRRDESLVSEVRRLRVELERLRADTNAQQIAIATATSNSARILRRWEGGGMPDTRSTT